MEIGIRRIARGVLVLVGASALVAGPVLAVDVFYTGTIRNLVRSGQSPPQVTPSFSGVLRVTTGGGIELNAGDANFATTIVVTNPPTFAGVLQQTNYLTITNFDGTARPGNGPGPYTFAFPSPTGSPPLNAALGVTRRLGGMAAAGGGANFGGTIPFLFNFVADIVFFGGGGGAPNLACPIAVPSIRGQFFTLTTNDTCIGLTTGPLPAMTLPAVNVPRNLTVSGIPATTRTVFALAPAPPVTTTLTEIGSDVRNSAGTTGMIQLVAPFLFHTQQGTPVGPQGQGQNAGITELTFTLMPEPARMAVFLAGIAAIGLLRAWDARRR